MTISGADIKRLRERQSLSQAELAEILNQTLGRNYRSGSVSPWERDLRPIPADVSSLIEQLMLDAALPADAPPEPHPADGLGDTAPGDGETPPSQVPLTSGGVYVRACTELWEMIGAGVGMAGAATGNQALMVDGAIIVADKDALGAAWGRLAETNETLRKMIVSMTEGGAWLQVALVTGTTVSKCYQSHAERSLSASAGQNGHDEYEPVAVA